MNATILCLLIGVMILCLLVLVLIQHNQKPPDYYMTLYESQKWERINKRYDMAIWFVWTFVLMSVGMLVYLKIS